jgi:hypothetical protein
MRESLCDAAFHWRCFRIQADELAIEHGVLPLADSSCVEFTASLRDARECAEPIVFRFKQEIRMIEWLAEECKRAGSMREKRIALGCGPELARIKERKSKLHAFRITSRIATRHPTVLIQFRK